jgi:steroid 5-alpha reductase family enzyme
LHWWAYVALAATAPCWWVSLLVPAVLLDLFFRVTGIPPAEAQALASRGDDHREYQRTTSVFFPWFPRREHVAN